ncbi:MAG: DUF177 domain-containing protein [Candidatus Omnitrophica bacterium]|nr:DUF177 domain-containing protein [Candidatus Omnitrophota bacterium]
MRVVVRDLSKGEQVLTGEIKPEIVGAESLYRFTKPIKVVAKAQRTGDDLVVKANVDFGFASICSRCAEDVESDIKSEFWLDFEIPVGAEYIEIDDDIRQEILIGLPVKILCSENCQGLCPQCGKNLNQDQCMCKKDQ